MSSKWMTILVISVAPQTESSIGCGIARSFTPHARHALRRILLESIPRHHASRLMAGFRRCEQRSHSSRRSRRSLTPCLCTSHATCMPSNSICLLMEHVSTPRIQLSAWHPGQFTSCNSRIRRRSPCRLQEGLCQALFKQLPGQNCQPWSVPYILQLPITGMFAFGATTRTLFIKPG